MSCPLAVTNILRFTPNSVAGASKAAAADKFVKSSIFVNHVMLQRHQLHATPAQKEQLHLCLMHVWLKSPLLTFAELSQIDLSGSHDVDFWLTIFLFPSLLPPSILRDSVGALGDLETDNGTRCSLPSPSPSTAGQRRRTQPRRLHQTRSWTAPATAPSGSRGGAATMRATRGEGRSRRRAGEGMQRLRGTGGATGAAAVTASGSATIGRGSSLLFLSSDARGSSSPATATAAWLLLLPSSSWPPWVWFGCLGKIMESSLVEV